MDQYLLNPLRVLQFTCCRLSGRSSYSTVSTPVNPLFLEMMEKPYIPPCEIRTSLLTRPVVFEKSFFDGRYHQIKMNWLEYPSIVKSSRRTVNWRYFYPVYPELNRRHPRMNLTDGRMLIYGGPDALWSILLLFSRPISLYVCLSSSYWHIGVFAKHLEGLMNCGRFSWFRHPILSAGVLFEDHCLL